MNRSTRSRRVLEMRDEESLDRISSLPDELLGHILSLLSTCNAVMTSVLSTRWRYLFTLTNNLYFNDVEYFGSCESPVASQSEALKRSFEKFVYGVLALHNTLPIQNFCLLLGCPYDYDSSHLRVWIKAAILKEVRHLCLSISSIPNALPNCIFDSQTLASLEINSQGYMFRVPGIVRLPSLRTLKLQNMTFLDGDSVNRFFVGCPELEELGLYYCQLNTDHFCVSAKALKNLTIFYCAGHIGMDVPKLANINYSCSLLSSAAVKMTLSLKTVCGLINLNL